MANNNYPQITTVTSETLQAQIRNLLPSQEGFGTDLMAQNVIVPVIDLTAAAEGSTVPQNLQTALAFGSQNTFGVSNTTTTIINTTGFYRVYGNYAIETYAGTISCKFQLTDGLATKNLVNFVTDNGSGSASLIGLFDFVVFLAAGESLVATSNYSRAALTGSYRQIADVNGTLVNPSGFNPQ